MNSSFLCFFVLRLVFFHIVALCVPYPFILTEQTCAYYHHLNEFLSGPDVQLCCACLNNMWCMNAGVDKIKGEKSGSDAAEQTEPALLCGGESVTPLSVYHLSQQDLSLCPFTLNHPTVSMCERSIFLLFYNSSCLSRYSSLQHLTQFVLPITHWVSSHLWTDLSLRSYGGLQLSRCNAWLYLLNKYRKISFWMYYRVFDWNCALVLLLFSFQNFTIRFSLVGSCPAGLLDLKQAEWWTRGETQSITLPWKRGQTLLYNNTLNTKWQTQEGW